VWRYVVASSISGVVTFLAIQQLAGPLLVDGVSQAILRIALVSISFSILYIAAVVALHGGLEPILRVQRLLRTMVSNAERERVTT
jgi:hypothetical protein